MRTSLIILLVLSSISSAKAENFNCWAQNNYSHKVDERPIYLGYTSDFKSCIKLHSNHVRKDDSITGAKFFFQKNGDIDVKNFNRSFILEIESQNVPLTAKEHFELTNRFEEEVELKQRIEIANLALDSISGMSGYTINPSEQTLNEENNAIYALNISKNSSCKIETNFAHKITEFILEDNIQTPTYPRALQVICKNIKG